MKLLQIPFFWALFLLIFVFLGYPSAARASLQRSCSGIGTATFEWDAVGGAPDYILRIDKNDGLVMPAEWNPAARPSTDQWVCVHGTSATRPIIPGASHNMWSVEPSDVGCKSRTAQIQDFGFTCPPISIDCTTSSTSRCAECDACGYCFGKGVPGNWSQCRACIYPYASNVASDNNTLVIDPAPGVNRSLLQPAKGKYFTQLGCIDTSMSSFQSAGAAGGVLNFILTRVIFPTAGVLAFLSIIYGAFLLATSQDDQMQIQRGRRFIYGGIIGAIFTFSVVLIVNTIGIDILRIPGFSR